jgi:formylglycine-generating enzyme
MKSGLFTMFCPPMPVVYRRGWLPNLRRNLIFLCCRIHGASAFLNFAAPDAVGFADGRKFQFRTGTLCSQILLIGSVMMLGNHSDGQSVISQAELLAPKFEKSQDRVVLTINSTVGGRAYQLQRSMSLAESSWSDLGCIVWGNGGSLKLSDSIHVSAGRQFYRFSLRSNLPSLDGLYLIPAGSFAMGDQSSPQVGYIQERPVHSLQMDAFFIAKYEVTNFLWNNVRSWASTNGYLDLPSGNGIADNHPVHTVTWYDSVKWCNARSEKEGLNPCYTIAGSIYRSGIAVPFCDWSANGYRLPTEAEWERAARGGLVGLNFPWGNTISHNDANYFSSSSFDYDIGPSRGYHPSYISVAVPYTSPVGTFSPNGYGLHDSIGNVFEWCWDYFYIQYYSASPNQNPRGPETEPKLTLGSDFRSYRGGDWFNNAKNGRTSVRGYYPASSAINEIGLRIARSAVP